MASRLRLSMMGILALSVTSAQAQTYHGGGLTLSLDRQANVAGMRVGNVPLGVAPQPLASLCDTGQSTFCPATVIGPASEHELSLDFGEAKAKGTLAVRAEEKSIRFACQLKGDDLPARGMLLRFALPFDATGWAWHNDMQIAVPIQEHRTYENVRALREHADLPEWKDKPALRMGYSNRNFCTVVTGPVGVCLAVPIDKPCTFRTGYDAEAKRLEIVFDFALTPDTRKPNEVAFAFDLYSCDPAWGFRDALKRYYQLYPKLFRVHTRDQGQWMAFSRLSEIDNVNEFGFGLQEGAPEPEYDDKIDVLSTIYLTHAGMFARIPNYDPEKDPLPPLPVQVDAMEATFKRRTRLEDTYHQVGLHTADGQWDIRKCGVYGHIIAQFNLDPELSYGKWTLGNADARTVRFKQKRGAELDGFYYDGLSGGINYRREHFRTADAPCLWNPAHKKPFLNNFFSSCEFARAAAEHLRPRGQITMMNGALGASFYVAPWLDVLGAETGLRISRENLNYIRATTYHKPFMTLLKGNYEQRIGHAEMELFMKRCLAYGVFPGFFDWPPSGLGPGSRYWDHPSYFERDRGLFRKYQPLCRTLALAGWEPVTHAHSSAPKVFVERFGPGADRVLWLTLLNEDHLAHRTQLTVDATALGLDPASVKAVDVVSGQPVPFAVKGQQLTAALDVPADGVMAIQIARPADTARWRVAQSLRTLDRGCQMRKVESEKPAMPVHWRPAGRRFSRKAQADGSSALVVQAEGAGERSIRQWVMLFQEKASPVKIRVRAKAEALEGKVAISCRAAWLTRSFKYFENHSFDLPSGTYDWRDFEFSIESEHAFRSIYVVPVLRKGAKGTLKLASISFSDENRAEYAVDPTFDEWYEPVPSAMRPQIQTSCEQLRSSLVALRNRATEPTSSAARDALFAAFTHSRALKQVILREQAENGCRRVLRDLETIDRHLGFAALTAFNATPPAITGPIDAAPGDELRLEFAVPTIPGIKTEGRLICTEARLVSTASGATLHVPADAEIGSALVVHGRFSLGPTGQEAHVDTRHRISIVPPLDIALQSQGVDQDSGACRLRVVVRNNRCRATEAKLTVSVPEGWEVKGPRAIRMEAGAEGTTELALSPSPDATPGSVEVSVAAKAGRDTTQDRMLLLYIPKEANLLRNSSFEDGAERWGLNEGESMIDRTNPRSGKACMKLHNPARVNTGVSQSVRLDQKTPCPIFVRASSRSENVSGKPGKGYSLYVDIYYTDGTPLYGQTHNFMTGTTDWQLGELYIEPAKPIRNVNVYLLLRRKTGTAYFDDIALMEDPRRKGNIARDGTASVDSNYSRYDPTPINDGIIQGEGLHWTKEAWASADSQSDHFIVLTFDRPRTVARASIYWSLDAGIPRTSAEIQLQVPDGDAWRTVATISPNRPAPQSEIRLKAPATASKFRLFQPAKRGPRGRPGLMWVREVELFEPKGEARRK